MTLLGKAHDTRLSTLERDALTQAGWTCRDRTATRTDSRYQRTGSLSASGAWYVIDDSTKTIIATGLEKTPIGAAMEANEVIWTGSPSTTANLTKIPARLAQQPSLEI